MNKKRNVGKVVTGMLVGSVVGATVGLLMAPASGHETRRKLTGDMLGAREKMKSAAGNVESQARELLSEVREEVETDAKTVNRRRKAASTSR